VDADFWIDRRRLKRALTLWRVAAVLAVVAAALIALSRFEAVVPGTYIARLSVEGIIVDKPERDRALAEVAEDPRVQALIVRIDSPGGTVVGGETLYRALREVAARKPVVSVMGGLATSAAYMTALGTDRILARQGTVTGSIGVILQATDITELLDDLGIKPEIVKSAPLKAQPNPLEPFTQDAREATRAVVLDMYELFVEIVAERRELARNAVILLADGRIFTGRQAFANGLIDAIGDEDDAKAWLEATHGVDAALEVRDVEVDDPEQTLLDLVTGITGKLFFSQRVRLDGLLSVWHPSL
jgi:protease-4